MSKEKYPKDIHVRTYLHGLSKAHLISKDAIQSPLIHGHQPVQPNVLVLAQLVPQKKWHLGLHLHVHIVDSTCTKVPSYTMQLMTIK